MKEYERKRNTGEYRYLRTERLARLLACGVFALGAVGCEPSDEQALSRPDVPQFTYGSAIDSSALPPDQPNQLDGMVAVVVEDPTSEDRHIFSDDHSIRKIFRSADMRLAETTSGRVSLPNDLSITHAEVSPTGKVGNTVCYSGDDLLAVDKKVAGEGAFLLLDETPGCEELVLHDGVVLYAWTYHGAKTAVFGNKAVLEEGTILHETGHLLTFPHHAVVGERSKKDKKSYVFDGRPIGERLNEPSFGATRREDGGINEYAATSSVMGNSRRGGSPKEAYHPLELAKIIDEVKVPTVETEQGTYVVQAQGLGVRGVKMVLPKEHPLHKIDADMEAVSVSTVPRMTPGAGSIDKINIIVTAESPSKLYDIYALPPVSFDSIAEFRQAQHGERWRTAYIDETLNVTVQVSWPQDADVRLRIAPYL